MTLFFRRPPGAAAASTRAEAELAQRLLRSREPRALPVAFHDGTLFAVPEDAAERLWRQRAANRDAGAADEPAPGEDAAEPSPAETAPDADRPPPGGPASRALRWAARGVLARLPQAIREDVRAILLHSREIGRAALRRPRRHGCAPAPAAPAPRLPSALAELRSVVHPQPGDLLFTAAPHRSSVLPRRLAEWRRERGLRVAWVADEPSRASRPEADAPGTAAAGSAADTVALIDAADLIFAASPETARELGDVAAAHGRTAPPIHRIALAEGRPPSGGAAQNLPAPLAGRRFALAFGAVDAGSDPGLLLRCWERLVAADAAFPLDLVIVGRPTHEAGPGLREMPGSPLLKGRVFWADACPEALLAALCESCELVLCPSAAEAAAMALGRARASGRDAIATDAAARCAAVRGAALLLDPSDEAAWLAALREAAARPVPRGDGPPPPEWDATAAAMLAALVGLCRPAAREAA